MSANNVVVIDLKTRDIYECNAEEVCSCGSFGCMKINKKKPKTLTNALIEAQGYVKREAVEYGIAVKVDVKKEMMFHQCGKCK